MRQFFIRFVASACLYGLYMAFTEALFVYPSQIVNLAIVLPPILGIMWGGAAALGISITGCILLLYSHNFDSLEFTEYFHLAAYTIYLFLATYLPYFLWYKWQSKNPGPLLTKKTLWKLIAILFVTFAVTSIFRGLTAPQSELNAVTELFGFEKDNAVLVYAAVCFINDFLISISCDLVAFFVLALADYKFHTAKDFSISEEEKLNPNEKKAFYILAMCYLIFPAMIAYCDLYQIYGMDRLETWMNFIVECLTFMDAYIILIIFMLLKYRRSVMLEIVFLVALTVFLSAAVLGLGSSFAMFHMVKSHADDSLHAMSVICRERLDRTFFCIRQAVNGMERHAINSIESYQRFVEDAEYRKNYLSNIEMDFDAIAMDTDGCLAYYLRIAPEIDGNRGGFSKEREYGRWEGALSPFIRRDPIDLSLYPPEDIANVGWYYTPMKSKHATWIEPYVDPTAKSYVISYVAPIFIEGKFIGVIGMDIDFNFIIQELRRMSIYDYGYVYVMNRNNTVLYHRDQVQGTQFQSNPEFQEIELYLTNGMWLGIATPLSKVHDERNHILMHLIASILIVAMAVSIGSLVWVSRIIRPLSGMTDAAKRIASGDLNVTISYESGNELGLLVKSIREMASKLEFYVYRDKLTGVRNAAAYIVKSSELNKQIEFMPDLAYAIVLFDVNFLKKVNDNLGHQAGDKLIQNAAKVICDVFKNSHVYRIGGDEFVAVLEGEDYENRDELLLLFDKTISETTFTFADEVINLSVARGMAIYESGMVFADVSKKADGEMYNNKKAIKAKFGEDVR